jgi:serine/threonine protein kinase
VPDDTPQENSGLPALEKTLGIPQSGSDTSANAGGRSVGVFEPETVIDGKYKVLSVIGRGGMGTVYRVEQIFLRKEFALKTIHGEFNESAWRRFELEAKAASKLDHPNTVRVSDFGLLESKHPYFVMELVEGTSLADHLKFTGRLSYEDIFSIFIPLCWALQDAHEKGIVHRDVKPSNVMLIGQKGNWQSKLLDFGIAKICEGEQSALTQTGELIGSPLYMSPEQCTGNKVDHRSDIYSLGCTLYEAITGCPPFSGASAVATIGMHLHEKPLSLKEASMGEDFPQALEQIVQTMLAKNPDQRFASIKEVGKSLMQLQQGDKVKIKAPAPSEKQSVTAKRPELNVNYILFGITLMSVGFAFYFWYQTSQLTQKQELTQNREKQEKRDEAAIHDSSKPSTSEVKKLETESLRSALGAADNTIPFSKLLQTPDGVPFRQFNFPTRPLGLLVDTKTERQYVLQGEQRIVWHGPMELRPTSTALTDYHGLLERFRNDEIESIHFASEQQFFADSLDCLTNYRNLEELSFKDTDFKDEGLKALEDLQNLHSLNLLATDVTVENLAKFGRLKQLRKLWIGHFTHLTPLLKALQGGNLEQLMIRYCPLAKGDGTLIAALPKLKSLTIDQGYFVDGELLRALVGCKTLRALDIQHCLVEEKDFATLGKLQQLALLDVTTGRFSPDQLATIRKMLPKCQIVAH